MTGLYLSYARINFFARFCTRMRSTLARNMLFARTMLPLTRIFLCLSILLILHHSIAIPTTSTSPTILSGQQCAADGSIYRSISANLSSLIREKVLPTLRCDTGSCKSNPGASCKQIAEERSDAPSGDYWISLCNGSAMQVFCDMNSRCCNSSSGWMRAAYLNMTDRTHNCPAGTYLGSDPKRLCRRKIGTGCKSIFFPVHFLPYSRVCGRVIAYQDGTADAFWQYHYDNSVTLDDDFLDGVTISVGYPRTHVWSFAVSNTEGGDGAETIYSCPCARTDVPTASVVPPFVEDEYFCESGAANLWGQVGTLYLDDPVWDGENCPQNSTCCQLNNPPWFCKDLGAEFRNDLEVRLCGDEDLGNEDVPLELIELYVQ